MTLGQFTSHVLVVLVMKLFAGHLHEKTQLNIIALRVDSLDRISNSYI